MLRCIFEDVYDGMYRVISRLLVNLVIRFVMIEFLTNNSVRVVGRSSRKKRYTNLAVSCLNKSGNFKIFNFE